jgi:hypothetical protein
LPTTPSRSIAEAACGNGLAIALDMINAEQSHMLGRQHVEELRLALEQ